MPLHPPERPEATERLSALTSVYLRERDHLMTVMAVRTGSRDVAADLLQEVWLRIAQVANLPTPENPRAFLSKVAANLALDWLRRNRFVSRFHDLKVDPTVVPEAAPDLDRALQARAALNHLREAVDRLPRQQREVFLLCHGQGLTAKEAAERLGLSHRTVEGHYGLAVSGLRKSLVEARLWP